MACTAAALTEQQADRFFDRRRVVSQVKSDDFFGKIFRTFCVFWPEIFGSFWAFFSEKFAMAPTAISPAALGHWALSHGWLDWE